MSGPKNDLRQRVRTVPIMPLLDPQKALSWVLGREAADWNMPAICPRCDSGRALLTTFFSPGGNIWFRCSQCGSRSFYEELIHMGVTNFEEFQAITRDCGGDEIDGEWVTNIGVMVDLVNIIQERVVWKREEDAGFAVTSEEAEKLWGRLLGRQVSIEHYQTIHLRLQFNVLGRLGCIVAYVDSARMRRTAELPAIYFDDLGPVFNIDKREPSWHPHLLIGSNWEQIYAAAAELRGRLDTRYITKVRLSEKVLSPMRVLPCPVRWITTLDAGTVSMLEMVTAFPPETRLSVLSNKHDRRPSLSLSILTDKDAHSRKRELLDALFAAANGQHSHPGTRDALRRILS